ncbi:MAG: hypothetical protein U5N85_21905 [Arcicella sp.]|nr:hypothetical protein [Arcicella sp.]
MYIITQHFSKSANIGFFWSATHMAIITVKVQVLISTRQPYNAVPNGNYYLPVIPPFFLQSKSFDNCFLNQQFLFLGFLTLIFVFLGRLKKSLKSWPP